MRQSFQWIYDLDRDHPIEFHTDPVLGFATCCGTLDFARRLFTLLAARTSPVVTRCKPARGNGRAETRSVAPSLLGHLGRDDAVRRRRLSPGVRGRGRLLPVGFADPPYFGAPTASRCSVGSSY